MDNQHLKKLSYLGAVGTVENLVKRLRQRQNDLLVYISSLGEMFPPRLSPSPSVYYFVCFAPFTEEDGGRAVDSHDRWQSVCVCMLLCLFCTPLFLRGVSARHNQYSGIVLPPHLIQWDPQVWVWGVWLVKGGKSHFHASDAQGQSAWSIWKMHHHTTTLALCMVYMCMWVEAVKQCKTVGGSSMDHRSAFGH